MTPPDEDKEPGDAPERFLIPAEAGYSEYWRRDKSPVAILELAKLLQGIRKVVAHVGRNVGTVSWKGMQNRPDGIVLDPSPVIGTYPVPASKADIAVGLAVTEAYRQTEWSDHVKRIATARFRLPPDQAYKFDLYLEMAEKIYVDLIADRGVLGRYAEKARKWTIAKAARHFASPPTFAELLHIWWETAAAGDRKITDHKDPYYRIPLAILNGMVDDLRSGFPRHTGVTDRCEFRLNLYMSNFNALHDHVRTWPGDCKDPFFISVVSREDVGSSAGNDETVDAAIRVHADEIEHNLKGKHVDFTERVKSVVADPGSSVRVEGKDFVVPSMRHIDNAVLYKLQIALRSVSRRNSSFNRGLESGKIDRSRLYRARTTGRIFSQKKIHFELYNDIVVLVDCTGSMAEQEKWEKLEAIYQTLFTAFLSFNSTGRIFAYNERGDTCRITEIFVNGKFFRITPQGKTASGEAIIATSLSLKNCNRNPFIVHITDGACNWGCGVKDAIRYCREKRIRLITLGLECDVMNKEALSREYGGLIRFFNIVDELPGVFKDVLQQSGSFSR